MMVQLTDDIPDKLKPFAFHGLDLSWKASSDEAVGECPFCGASKFSVKIRTGLFRCLRCNVGTDKGKSFNGGNAIVFIRLLWEKSFELTTTATYAELAVDRKLLQPESLIRWEIAYSFMTQDWLVPGYNAEGKMCTLYRYISDGQRKLLMPTPTLGHKLHGMSLYDARKPRVMLCEGIWDGIALFERLRELKPVGDTLALTASEDHSLFGSANVLATPACGVFFESWLPLFASKEVCLMYDNDHERENPKTGQMIPPGALEGMKRTANILRAAKNPPEEIHAVAWGGESQHWTPELPHGYDLRDDLNTF